MPPHFRGGRALWQRASLGGGWARGAPGRQLAPAERARGRFLTSCLGAGERPLPRATRPLDAVGPLPQDERGRSERGARRRAKGRERSDTTRHERSDTTRHEFFSCLFFGRKRLYPTRPKDIHLENLENTRPALHTHTKSEFRRPAVGALLCEYVFHVFQNSSRMGSICIQRGTRGTRVPTVYKL